MGVVSWWQSLKWKCCHPKQISIELIIWATIYCNTIFCGLPRHSLVFSPWIAKVEDTLRWNDVGYKCHLQRNLQNLHLWYQTTGWRALPILVNFAMQLMPAAWQKKPSLTKTDKPYMACGMYPLFEQMPSKLNCSDQVYESVHQQLASGLSKLRKK